MSARIIRNYNPLVIGSVAVGASVDPAVNVGRAINPTGNAHGFSDISQVYPSVYSCTGASATNVITATGHTFSNGDLVAFSPKTGGSSITTGTGYYVIEAAANTFKISTSAGGAAQALGSDITSASVSRKYAYNSFDALAYIGSGDTGTFDHYAAYQARPVVNASFMNNVYGYYSYPKIDCALGSTPIYHFFCARDSGSSGTQESMYGVFIGDITTGTTYPVAIASTSTARSYHNGAFTIGAASYGALNASAKFQVDSTTSGFLPPRMTTTQKNAISSPAAGLMVWDTTLGKLCVYNGSAWRTVTDT